MAQAMTTPAAVSCAGVTCLQSLIGEVVDLAGNCLYRQYEAHQCLQGGGYQTILHETGCSEIQPLPQGNCTNCGQCLGSSVPVPIDPLPITPTLREVPVSGRRHSAGVGLARDGIPEYGHVWKPFRQRIEAPQVDLDVVLIPGNQPGGNQRRRAALLWFPLGPGQDYGIGFEVAAGEPTIEEKDTRCRPLLPQAGRPLSYSVTIRKGTAQRHYAVYMKR